MTARGHRVSGIPILPWDAPLAAWAVSKTPPGLPRMKPALLGRMVLPGISAVFIKEIFTACLGSASVSSTLAALIRENMCPKKTQASEPASQNSSLGRGWGKRGALDAQARALTSACPDPGIKKTSTALVKIILLN